jgi:hypothetical protein
MRRMPSFQNSQHCCENYLGRSTCSYYPCSLWRYLSQVLRRYLSYTSGLKLAHKPAGILVVNLMGNGCLQYVGDVSVHCMPGAYDKYLQNINDR